MVIYKYAVGAGETIMPQRAEILSAQFQGGEIFVWAIVDPQRPPVTRKFNVLATGQDITGHPGKYLATLQEGIFVYHVFDFGEHPCSE